ncbi:DEAD/DEAH box helicase [Pseudenhygromyxa sp. WMMC2535]|uniref:DEAD/DEAH box helicase n=1 Tax=Pseudenhygromyxa sp. WMMC2535 TaxID=2712867 RepID=UPI00155407B2|nr:DEAD/DEAH box helicase [Pseudenhygromyxa sp. WMMC2535]
MREAFALRGVQRPWAHQASALDSLFAGRDLLLSTATASGKSFCYQAPVLQAALQDPSARALFLFPTKALARDQIEALRSLVAPGTSLAGCLGAGTYDGDTPPDQRRIARVRAHVIATNPDMLHRAVLPHHDRWATFLGGLRYVVIDELHCYRGVFGSHVANVLRRLWRACAFHGSQPQIIGCSATIANPRELASALCARDRFDLVDESTAPLGPRTFVIMNPAVVDPLTGVRRDYLKATRTVLAELRRERMTTLAFCRTRKAVELLTRYLREDESGVREEQRSPLAPSDALAQQPSMTTPDMPRFGPSQAVGPWARMRARPNASTRTAAGASAAESLDVPASAPSSTTPIDPGAAARARRSIRGYRGGYLPEHRREIEDALRRGEAEVVASTNALELGMDIGSLDAVVLAGYPGTRAATWQRSGRAGRRQAPSLTVMVLSSRPLDQFLAAAPEFLFSEPPEHARVDAFNPEVLIPHLRCAAYELPFGFSDADQPDQPDQPDQAAQATPDWWRSWGGLDPAELSGALDYLSERGALLREQDPDGGRRFYAIGSSFPAEGVDLRGTIEENFSVLEERPGDLADGRVLAEVDFEDAPLYLHPGAIYPIEGKTFEVRRLDWDERKAYVREVSAHYYTEAVCKLRVRMLEGDDADGTQARPKLTALPPGDPRRVHAGTGYAHVVRAVPGFKKLRFRTHENIGFGPVRLPDLELHTVAAYWAFPDALLAQLGDPHRRANAALAAAHAIHHVAAMVLMCEVGDLRHAVTSGVPGPDGVAAWAPVGLGRPKPEASLVAGGRPTIYLYDDLPGGAGLATRIHGLGRDFFEHVLAVARGCGCGHGCPTCIGTEVALDPPTMGAAPDPALELHARRHARADLLATLEAFCEGLEPAAEVWA